MADKILEQELDSYDIDGDGWRAIRQAIARAQEEERKLTLEKVNAVIENVRRFNVRRFDDKEVGSVFFNGWDSALDTLEVDLRELK